MRFATLSLVSTLLVSSAYLSLYSSPISDMAQLTLEDLIRVNKEQTELFMKFRDEDTEKRSVERKEDQKHLTDLIDKTFDKKIDSALNPLISRQEYYEEKTEIAISGMSADLSALRAQLATSAQGAAPAQPAPPAAQHGDHHPTFARIAAAHGMGRAAPPPPSDRPANKFDDEAAIARLIVPAKLTLGFEPIKNSHLATISRANNTDDKEQVLKLAVLDFLDREMTVRNLTSENIVKVFLQHGFHEDDCVRVYAQFDNKNMISTIYRNVHKLRNAELKVMLYAPYTHQDQLAYLNKIAKEYRYPEDPHQEKARTRIMFGRRDLYLQIKPESCNFWTTLRLDNLPPIQPISRPTQQASLSPPPGRQSDDSVTNKRGASSPPQSQSSAKDPRLANNTEDVSGFVPTATETEINSELIENDTTTNHVADPKNLVPDPVGNHIDEENAAEVESEKVEETQAKKTQLSFKKYVPGLLFSQATLDFAFNSKQVNRRHSINSLN